MASYAPLQEDQLTLNLQLLRSVKDLSIPGWWGLNMGDIYPQVLAMWMRKTKKHQVGGFPFRQTQGKEPERPSGSGNGLLDYIAMCWSPPSSFWQTCWFQFEHPKYTNSSLWFPVSATRCSLISSHITALPLPTAVSHFPIILFPNSHHFISKQLPKTHNQLPAIWNRGWSPLSTSSIWAKFWCGFKNQGHLNRVYNHHLICQFNRI